MTKKLCGIRARESSLEDGRVWRVPFPVLELMRVEAGRGPALGGTRDVCGQG